MLKVDINAEYVKNYLLDLKDSRQLSSTIIDMLKAYYEDEEVKRAYDNYVASNGPMAEIQKQLERIQLEHNKTVMTTSMLNNQVDQVKSQAETKHEDSVAQEDNKPVSVDPEILQRLEAIEKALPNITQLSEQMGKILSVLQVGGHPQSGTASSTLEAVELPSNHSTQNTAPTVSPPINNQTAGITQPEIQTTSRIPVIVDAPVILSNEESQPEDTKKRPSSFGRAAKSLKKDEN